MIQYPTPKYVLVQNFIIEKIETGVLKPGDKIPSEYELARMFNVSRVTVNSAVTQLNVQGVVIRIKGKGTFVKKPDNVTNRVNDSNIRSFKISSKGNKDSHRLLATEIITHTHGDKLKLMLLEGEKYHKITRLMRLEDKIIAVDYSYLPFSFFPREMDIEAIEQHYLHTFIKDYCHKKPRRLQTYIGITLPDVIQQQYLHANPDEPLLTWDTSVIDQNEMVLGYTTTCARPDDFQPYLNFLLDK